MQFPITFPLQICSRDVPFSIYYGTTRLQKITRGRVILITPLWLVRQYMP